MIWTELNDNLVFHNLKASDNIEVLQLMGDAMIQEGYGEEGFTEAVLNTEAKTVQKEGISIAVLNPQIEFDAMGEEDCRIPVKIVIMFTVAGKDKHIDRLLQILDMIKDEEILQGLLDAKNKKEIRTVIQKREKSDIN